jgi:hypothetical protein
MGYDLHEIGLARPAVLHQAFARNIVINFFNAKGFKEYEAFQEGTANHKPTCEKIPDVIFVNVQNKKVAVSVEIEKSWNGSTIYKIQNELIKRYKHQEVFLYNYTKNEWRKYFKKGKEIVFENTSLSDVLGVDFAEMIVLKP